MPAGVVLDTSYLITLAQGGRSHHAAARQYWKHFTENSIPMYLSTIVVSEFSIKQQIPDEILRSCVVLPFNWKDAIRAAALFADRPTSSGPASRDSLKDDMKIIAQAIVADAAWLITDDTNSLFRFAQSLRDARKASFRTICLDQGFDLSILDADGQHRLEFEQPTRPDEP